MADANVAWKLEEFVDSLVVELDKTRETLAVKAINKPLSYTVRELALDLNIFPSYDGDEVSFVTAQPGQQGSSKVTIQLGTITDQQVRATTKTPGLKNDLDLAEVEVDQKTRKQLRKYGVTSESDIKQIENKNVDLRKASDNSIDYTQLANQIEKSRRGRAPPRVHSASMSVEENVPTLTIRGENLAVNPRFEPVAVVNEILADVLSASEHELKIRIDRDQHRFAASNEVIITVDPFAVVRMRVRDSK
jgi:hypothetical protein